MAVIILDAYTMGFKHLEKNNSLSELNVLQKFINLPG